MSAKTMEQVQAAAEKLTGEIWQTPSMFSAIKQDGVAMYERARRGETVEVFTRRGRIIEDTACDCGYVFKAEEQLTPQPRKSAEA